MLFGLIAYSWMLFHSISCVFDIMQEACCKLHWINPVNSGTIWVFYDNIGAVSDMHDVVNVMMDSFHFPTFLCDLHKITALLRLLIEMFYLAIRNLLSGRAPTSCYVM